MNLFQPPKEIIFFKSNKYAFGPYLNGIGFEVIAFATGIPATLQAEFVAVQGAYNIAQSICVTIRQKTACMRAFGRTGK